MSVSGSRGSAATDFRAARPNQPFVKIMRLVNRYYALPRARLRCDIRDLDKLRGLPPGVVIAPNHSEYADAMVVAELTRQADRFITFMVTRESFDDQRGINGLALQWMGGFSVNRGGDNTQCHQFAKDLLKRGHYDLLIFPEGEIYLLNDLVMPFKPGVAMLALEAAADRRKEARSSGPLLIVPVAIKYVYLEDPLPQLTRTAAHLETTLFGEPRAGTLYDRVYTIGAELIARTEQTLGLHAAPGQDVYDRLAVIRERLLGTLEHRYLGRVRDEFAFDRARRVILHLLEALADIRVRQDLPDDEQAALEAELRRDLVRAQMAARSVSFAEDYLITHPTAERMAETLLKLEREVYDRYPLPLGVRRKAIVWIGDPIDVMEYLPAYLDRKTRKDAILQLVRTLQSRIQSALDAATAEVERTRRGAGVGG